MELTDTELIRRFVERQDESAFRALYGRHAPAIYGFVLRLTGGDSHEAADVVQDAWLRAAGRIRQFRGDSAFRTWISGIALNCYREAMRRESRNSPIGTRTTSAVAIERRNDDVLEILRTLSHEHRQALVLHDVEGYTHEEIAESIGIEVGTSKSRLSRARQEFRDRWRAQPGSGVKNGRR